MATYYSPVDLTNGVFVDAEYWNKLYGTTGSLQYLYETHTNITNGYHLKLQKTNPDSIYTSWIIPSTFTSWYSSIGPPTSNYVVSWDYAAIDNYPSASVSLWNNVNNSPNQIIIQKSGYYFVHAHLSLNNISYVSGELYGHILRRKSAGILESIGTDMIVRTPLQSTNGFPTWSNKLTTLSLNIASVYFLEKNDIIYIMLQSSLSTDRFTSFIANNYVYVPTAYSTSFAKGTTSFVTSSIKTSFVSQPYIGLSPSFFEVISIRLES